MLELHSFQQIGQTTYIVSGEFKGFEFKNAELVLKATGSGIWLTFSIPGSARVIEGELPVSHFTGVMINTMIREEAEKDAQAEKLKAETEAAKTDSTK